MQNISLSGLTSCGKTSYAKMIEKEFGFSRVSASAILLINSNKFGYQRFKEGEDKNHYWLKNKANKLNSDRIKNNTLDIFVDKAIGKKLIQEKNIVAETLTAPLIYNNKMKNILKIYFDVSLETRIKRAFISSDTISIDRLFNKIRLKDVASQKIIKEIWGVDIFDKKLIYDSHDVVIDTSLFNETKNLKIIEKEKKITQKLIWSIIILHQKKNKANVLEKDYIKAKAYFK